VCYSTRGYCSCPGLWRRLGLEGRRERRPRGFAHGRQKIRVFLLNFYLIRLIHLLSLNREDYLTLSKDSILSLNLTLTGLPRQPIRPDPLDPWQLTGTKRPSRPWWPRRSTGVDWGEGTRMTPQDVNGARKRHRHCLQEGSGFRQASIPQRIPATLERHILG
jgi:hypothetical protein